MYTRNYRSAPRVRRGYRAARTPHEPPSVPTAAQGATAPAAPAPQQPPQEPAQLLQEDEGGVQQGKGPQPHLHSAPGGWDADVSTKPHASASAEVGAEGLGSVVVGSACSRSVVFESCLGPQAHSRMVCTPGRGGALWNQWGHLSGLSRQDVGVCGGWQCVAPFYYLQLVFGAECMRCPVHGARQAANSCVPCS